MVAVRRVGSDRPPLPAVALCCPGSGPPAEESPEEKPYTLMKRATFDHSPAVIHRCEKFNFYSERRGLNRT